MLIKKLDGWVCLTAPASYQAGMIRTKNIDVDIFGDTFLLRWFFQLIKNHDSLPGSQNEPGVPNNSSLNPGEVHELRRGNGESSTVVTHM